MKKACHRHLAVLSYGLPAIHNPTLPPLILRGGEEGLILAATCIRNKSVDLQEFFSTYASSLMQYFRFMTAFSGLNAIRYSWNRNPDIHLHSFLIKF